MSDALRKHLVELQDIARRNMLSASIDEARYHAGRVDALRDALTWLAILDRDNT